MSNYFDCSLSELANMLRTNQLRAQDLLESTMDNHSRFTDSLDAYIAWDSVDILRQAKAVDAAIATGFDAGPLAGLPVSVKDLFGVEHYPTYAGSSRRLPFDWQREGPVINALKQQQAVITGKTHMVEFAFGGLGVNPHWESPRNPWDLHQYRVSGGSSSGAGVSLSVGSAVLALGTDTAGSVRIPASMTGNVGLKTSFGRWSLDGIVPLSPSLDTVGLLARNVDDVAYGYCALESSHCYSEHRRICQNIELSQIKIGMSDGLLWSDLSAGIAESVQCATDELVLRGAKLQSFFFPEAEMVYPIFKKGGLVAVELYVFLKNSLPDWLPLLDEKIAQRMEDAATLPACEYLQRVQLFQRLSQQANERLAEVDVLLCPTVPVTSPTMAEVQDISRYSETNLLSLRNTSIVNYLDLIAITLPVGLDAAGMPVGMQLITGRGKEDYLLALAGTIEGCIGNGVERLGRAPLAMGC